jgi:hypothetical protein
MEVFKLIHDEKVIVWRRNYVSVEANSRKEAILKLLKCPSNYIDDSEYLFETETDIHHYDNIGPNVEVMDNNGKTIYSDDIGSI